MKNPKTTISGVIAAVLAALLTSGEIKNETQKEVVSLFAAIAGSVFAFYSKDSERP